MQPFNSILDRKENRFVRKTTGQLSWLSSQTRPDLAFDALNLSICLNKARFKDAKYSKKVLLRAKEDQYEIKFSHLGHLKNLHLEIFADASLGNVEHNSETKSVMGSFIGLANDDLKTSPLSWRSKLIERVAQDIKTAETLALEASIDDGVFLASMISELYGGDQKIPIIVNEDSRGLVDSIYSTKKIKKKTMRVVLSGIEQYLKMV